MRDKSNCIMKQARELLTALAVCAASINAIADILPGTRLYPSDHFPVTAEIEL